MIHAEPQHLPSLHRKRFRPKGIVFVTDSFYPLVDGVVRVVDNMHSYYLARNVPSYVICGNFSGGLPRKLENTIRLPSIPIPGGGRYRLALPWFVQHQLTRLDPETISLVHIHTPFLISRRALSWARKHHKPVVLTFHSKYLEKLRNAFPPTLRWIANLLYHYPVTLTNECDIITTPTESFRKILISHGIRSQHCYVVPHGVADIPPITPKTLTLKKNPFLKKISVQKSTGKKILLYVGQLIREKNPDFLLRAWALLRDQRFPFFGVMVGGGDQLRRLLELIKELNLSQHVLLTQQTLEQEILHHIYGLSDLFTFPSTYETQGMVVLEAAQHGVPTLGIQKATGISDFIKHNQSGFLSPLEPQAYAQNIVDVFRDPVRYQRVSQAARETIPVSIEDMMANFETLYASCV